MTRNKNWLVFKHQIKREYRLATQKVKIIYKKLINMIRFIKTCFLWLIDNGISLIAKHPMWGFMLMLVFFLIFYFQLAFPNAESVPADLKKQIYTLFNKVGFNQFGDSNVRDLISRITSSLGFILSMLLAIYVFTHREQKSVAPSASIKSGKNFFVIMVLSVILFTMFTGYTLVENFNSLAPQPGSLHITKLLFARILLWFACLIWSISYFTELVQLLFETMSINKMLKTSIQQTDNDLRRLTLYHRHPLFKNFLKKNYMNLHYTIESVFQNLKYAADNNMNKEFEENINNFSRVIDTLKGENRKYNINNVATFLLEQDKKHFIDLYNSLLRNTLSLINHLYKNQHYRKGRNIIALYFTLYLNGEDRLKQQFALSLKEFLDSLDMENERQLRAFLDELSILTEEQTLIIYKSLLMKLVVQNNVKMLTTVVYDFKENIFEKVQQTKRQRTKILIQKNTEYLRNSLLVILMQCLVKSIEISHYSVTGFLVKFMITNFNGSELNKAFKTLKKNRNLFTKVLEQNTDFDKIEEKDFELISINFETFDYCCKKLCILLYGQQLFAERNKLWFTENDHYSNEKIDIQEEFFNCSFSEYMLKKVESASYGLLFLKDKSVMKEIYSILNVNFEHEGKKIKN